MIEEEVATVNDMDGVSENLKREISRFLAQYLGKKRKSLSMSDTIDLKNSKLLLVNQNKFG